MHENLTFADDTVNAVPIYASFENSLAAIKEQLSDSQASWLDNTGFRTNDGELALIPDVHGNLSAVALGLGKEETFDPFLFGGLAKRLPEGTYSLKISGEVDFNLAVLGWLLGCYTFDKYTKSKKPTAKLQLPEGFDEEEVSRLAAATSLTRDLVNTPTNDMGPEELESAFRSLAKEYSAAVSVTIGSRLKDQFPLIHSVGRASDSPPRLLDMTWGDESHPKVTLVGKGVCFDTGGLDLKPSSAMLIMKKDMGGSANVLGLAKLIMDAKLPIRLRVLIPAVENSVSSNAFRPGDIIRSRKGLTVEIGNTDAEGRLVLADALHLADEEEPDLLIDMATLTGAARVALGPEIPPFYTNDNELANQISAASRKVRDPLWQMPLWEPYDKWLSSKAADLNNVSSGGFAGSITAALFLARFVEHTKSYVHFDIYAWNPGAKPGRPDGGEAQGIRALYEAIKQRYCSLND